MAARRTASRGSPTAAVAVPAAVARRSRAPAPSPRRPVAAELADEPRPLLAGSPAATPPRLHAARRRRARQRRPRGHRAGRGRRRPRCGPRSSFPPAAASMLSARLDPMHGRARDPDADDRPAARARPGLAAARASSDVPPNTVAIVEPDARVHRGVPGRAQPRDGPRAAVARVPDRPARHGVLPVLGPARRPWRRTTAPAPDRDIPDSTPGLRSADAPRRHTWTPAAGRDLIVLLVRGDLLQRYPRVTIYLQRGALAARCSGATSSSTDRLRPCASRCRSRRTATWEARRTVPVSSAAAAGADRARSSASRSPRATYAGHRPRPDASARRATDDQAGWYVVFEEQPTEPRFGPPPPPPAPQPPPATAGDQMAVRLLRPAFRLSVHASDLIGS